MWLALVAAVAAAVGIALLARSRRAEPSGVPAPPEEQPAVASWPPAPILGTPTAEDLRRYAHRPSVLDRPAVSRFLEPREPREPLDRATRRLVIRWGVAALALVVLAGGTHLLESRVFPEGDGVTQAMTSDVSCGAPGVRCEVETEEVHAPPPDADCRPGGAAPRVRRPDPKVTRAVNRQWRRIETWLRTNAPRSHRALGRPAEAGTIAVAEAQMGLRFPDDLKASLLRHDGGLALLGHWTQGVRDIRDTWRMLCESDDMDMAEDPRGDWWDGRMIPFGADGSGNHLVVDSVRRDVGETDHEGGMGFRPAETRIRSYHALLKATADALESGGSIGYWKPGAVSGSLDWQIL
ncbi:SMI1/KNR4 family protein [Nonomuraea sp. MCN248]|uniref:SMI1/KNR4 family protein n=1 Tax=Nonomuraea corallina TaxID=2989783 RepID=A0ABT4S481_9ACTN|nr:SMI1/KNR4 family protein [Nonomuraea corallina]MDA0631960.1 SMI1/KNR4 family protein [Nonomuraea corallina]